jgi:hypothetical protein
METTLEAKKHVLCELNREGHTEVRWNPAQPDSVAAARASFDAMKKAGYHMFASEDGKPGRRIDSFDPTVERIIAVKQIVAG